MKKIMFNDKYGLTQAVLEGRKTMTRRVVNIHDADEVGIWDAPYITIYKDGRMLTDIMPTYKVGEEVAVAQAYRDIEENKYFISQCLANLEIPSAKKYDAGWNNKMFTSSYYMPHRIRITYIKVERLRDISSEDCLKEGIEARVTGCHTFYYIHGEDKAYNFPKQAFSALIDKVSGKGTWESNPWVFVYEFELLNS